MVMSVPSLLPTFAPYPFTMVRGENDRVWDAEGNAYWDFYGGHCVCLTGHCHPKVVEAIRRQAGELLFYSTAGKIDVRDQAAEALVRYAGDPMASVFFCNSGAEANENALKAAAKITGRQTFIRIQGGWHGRTLLALAVTDDPPIREPYEGLLPFCPDIPFNDVQWLQPELFEAAAAIILEPIQSMSGIVSAEREWLEAVRKRCDEAGTLLIFDEIQTGFGRLGAPFAKDVFGVRPDMITAAKGIASGVPMGAVLMSEKVASQLKAGDMGSTFGGGPLACAACLATLEVLAEEELAARAKDREKQIRRALEGTVVREIRGRGLLLGLDCGDRAKDLRAHLLAQRILVGGSHDPTILRLMPPLTLTDAAIDALSDAVRSFA